jgi:hypothetical protein
MCDAWEGATLFVTACSAIASYTSAGRPADLDIADRPEAHRVLTNSSPKSKRDPKDTRDAKSGHDTDRRKRKADQLVWASLWSARRAP